MVVVMMIVTDCYGDGFVMMTVTDGVLACLLTLQI